MNIFAKLDVFDRMILLILLYGSEVIRINTINDLEKKIKLNSAKSF